jgi:paraquat-inducible protein B
MGTLEPGPHTVGLSGLDALTPGLYFVRLMQGERTAVGRFTRLKTPPN